jgi:coproporphyrinogen III oxidase-like Fe-S oxidoreductase
MALNEALVTKAVHALFKYEEKKRNDSQKSTLIDGYSKPFLVQVCRYCYFSSYIHDFM